MNLFSIELRRSAFSVLTLLVGRQETGMVEVGTG